jgi:activator of 2-hydroxyglutaryl-CoA dehydratase/predicted nucleotide-binding protein (sugar kinase/HSP70/actin superfamily)
MAGTPRYRVGIDVGSTTVKAVVVHLDQGTVVWEDYRRHETRQPETLLDFLQRMEREAHVTTHNARIFMTGSGGSALAPLVGARFVQEVVAVSMAVESRHPDANSVIELGGQDAKIIVFIDDGRGGLRKKVASMNDRCAGGTGAVIDKIAAKLKITPSELATLRYAGVRVHPVAGKCGVFAETDINSLHKQGVPTAELMASLFDALVLQNLTVLARGNTLRPRVLLLGGPHTFIPALREAWQAQLPLLWAERKVAMTPGVDLDDLITVPDHAQYFAAFGAAEAGRVEEDNVGRYRSTTALERYLRVERLDEKAQSGVDSLSRSGQDLAEFECQYSDVVFVPPPIVPGAVVRGFLGIDGGSTSTKAVLVSEGGDVLAKTYRLSNGNPIQDTIELIDELECGLRRHGARVEVLGAATTGYAKNILRDVFGADVALVETVAHAQAALRCYDDPHVIVDVGGQDIKLIVLRDGRVKDFRLNTQCSAGNGYFLQATAEALGIPVERYAEHAFSASRMPAFGYGCAVFLQADIVNVQRQGWESNEILAGLAAVLPKNIFYYVAAVSSPARLGQRFVLQGGTQRNLAVVKAEVDFIRRAFDGSGVEPDIVVHEHCGESGAIGAALEAVRLWREGRTTTFIGLDAARAITYRTTCNEETRCHYCKNTCQRTFVDVEVGPVHPARRFIIASCEKGAALDIAGVRDVKGELDAIKAANPNLVEIAGREVWKPRHPASVADPVPSRIWTRAGRERAERIRGRADVRVGIPRALNLYTYAPLFSGYLESLGIRPGNIVYSDYTTDALYRSGSARGAIDPCFPSKVALAHVHNLLRVKHVRQPLDCIFFPMMDVLDSPLVNVRASNACPTAALTPEVVKAAFTKEADAFAAAGVVYLDPIVDLSDRRMLGRQMFECWAPILGLSEEENARAIEAGYSTFEECWRSSRARGRAVIDQVERENRLAIVVLGRPYHHDPGINHGILEELQRLGYPILSQSTLPLDEDLLDRLFGDEVRDGTITHPLDILDVWKNASVASTNHKLWAAKVVARHPQLVALELSNFKCGHDAPVYAVIEQIVEGSGTPFFAFKDIDENRSLGSIRIRIETIDYFLRRYRERQLPVWRTSAEIDRHLKEYERTLLPVLPGVDPVLG